MIELNDQELLKVDSFINNEWISTAQKFTVSNPARRDQKILISDGTAENAQRAVLAAKTALPKWKQLNAAERASLLKKWFELIIAAQRDLSTILTWEQGKPLFEAKGEIAYGASYFEWFAEEARRVYGDVIPSNGSNKRILVLKQPVGVVTSITPWNFPNAMLARKASAALAAGCSFVVKPAAETPLSALAMAELAHRAGIPPGVFNVVVGSDAQAIGEVLTQHEDVAKFTFTGSTAVGKKLISQCASGVKKVSMELGGNAPFIVFDDADIDEAVKGAIASKYRNAGQTCVCTNRLYVQNNIADTFQQKYVEAVAALKVGDGFDENTTIGPLISDKATAKVYALIENAIDHGATAVIGGNEPKDGFMVPTVLTGVTNKMAIAQEEIFGPVTPIISFDTEQEVIALANDTEYGLAAYFYTRDIGRIWRVGEALDFGMLGVNEGIISNAAAPFGGIKQSGNGREGSKYGLDDFLEIKYLCLGGMDK